jgi:FkbM family methyltransferase
MSHDPPARPRDQSPESPPSSPLRRSAGYLLSAIGNGPAGGPLVRSIGFLTRHRLLAQSIGASAVARAAATRPRRTLNVARTFGGGSRASLRLDLAYSGCVELLLCPGIGTADATTASLLIELARNAALVVDVGANVGFYTYLVAANLPDARVISLEPVPSLADLIEENVRRNGWQSRVSVARQAAGAARGQSLMYILPDADTEHTLERDRVAGREHETVSISVLPIDDLLTDSAVSPDRTVLKIDVEGFERSALDGMERTLSSRGRRPDIIMEFLGHAIEHERVIERVNGYGLDAYYIGPASLTPIRVTADLAAVHTLGYWNFLLTSRPADEISALSARAGVALRR